MQSCLPASTFASLRPAIWRLQQNLKPGRAQPRIYQVTEYIKIAMCAAERCGNLADRWPDYTRELHDHGFHDEANEMERIARQVANMAGVR